jgi:hypothetical protein
MLGGHSFDGYAVIDAEHRELKCILALNILSTFRSLPLRLLKVLTVMGEFILSNEAEIPISK